MPNKVVALRNGTIGWTLARHTLERGADRCGAIGAFEGYESANNGGWYVVPVPLLAVEGRHLGANFTIVPTIKDKVNGAVVLQIKLRVW